MISSSHGFAGRASRTLLVFWVLLGSAKLFLLPAGEPPFPYAVRGWQSDDGLPQNSVFSIAQTGDGYLWVGTREGLARFDGIRFTTFEDPSTPELNGAWITALCPARDGALWIGIESGGLARFQAGTVTRFSETNGLPSNQVRCLLEGADDSLWIGTEGGLAWFREGEFHVVRQGQGLGDNSVRAISQDPDGAIRVATRRGLTTLSPEGAVRGTTNYGASWNANALRCVRRSRSGVLWVGSTEGLTSDSPNGRTFYGVTNGLSDPVINTIHEDQAGQLWIGTYAGLSLMVNGKLMANPSQEPLFSDLIYTIFEDLEHNIWVGARDGLYRLNPARFTTYATQEGLSGNNVVSVLEDRSGTVWMGLWDGGLNALRENVVSRYSSTNALSRDSVLSLGEDTDGSLWIGMDFEGGLERFVEGCRFSATTLSSLIKAPIRAIHRDRQGALWVGTSAGLLALRDGDSATFNATNGLGGNTVLALLEDSTGNLWVGTDGGLSRWDGREFTIFTTRQGLSHNTVGALYEDAGKVLWIGTRGGGLNRYSGGAFKAYTTKNGLFSNEICEILEDDLGFLWLSSRRGIFRVSKQSLDELDHGASKQITCTAFGTGDGMRSVQCNGVAKPAGWKGRDGRLWFPTIRGVVAVASQIPLNTRVPPVRIEELLADKRPMRAPELHFSPAAATDNILRLPQGVREIEIRFTALSFTAAEKIMFKTRLEGMDSDWNEPGFQRSARYYNLTPGTYRFRVQACNNDGLWNETGDSLDFVLLPHFWQTLWFKGAMLVGVAGLLWLLYHIRVARLRELEHLRVQIAANLHDDVGARLTKAAMLSEAVDQAIPAGHTTKSHVRAISKTMREVIQAMDEIVWTINPKNDTLDNLANYIFQYAQEYFQGTNVRCRLDVPPQLPDWPVSTKVRHNLFMVVKEALNNILKHADATEVHLSLRADVPDLTITVSDDGRGFSQAGERFHGEGLRNMQTRLESIGGRLNLRSTPGAGTEIKVEAQIK